MNLILLTGMAVAFVSSCAGGSSEGFQIYHVVLTAVPGDDSLSWETAFTHPQDALDIATPGDQIWVAEGVYGPREAEDRNGAVLKRGVTVLGGFNGTESDVGERDPETALTVLNGQGYAYHVVLAIGVDNTVLDGFTITGGNA